MREAEEESEGKEMGVGSNTVTRLKTREGRREGKEDTLELGPELGKGSKGLWVTKSSSYMILTDDKGPGVGSRCTTLSWVLRRKIFMGATKTTSTSQMDE